MMLTTNTSDFAAIAYDQTHKDGYSVAVLAVRAGYNLYQDGRLELKSDQNLVLADDYEYSPHNSQLLRQSDLIPFKPHTDITVLGYTYSPDGAASKSWQFGVEVGNIRYILCAHGLRDWVKTPGGWVMDKTKPVDRVPLDYRYAAGSDYAESKSNPNGANPIGCAFIDRERPPRADRVPAPNIEHVNAPISDPYTIVPPTGLGPVAPFWAQRANLAGTYDKKWLEKRKPLLPFDFDYHFYQCANQGLISRRYLAGNERFTLYRLLPNGKDMTFVLPAIQPFMTSIWLDGRQVSTRLNLDGVHIDMRSLNEPWRVDLTWRAWIPICPTFMRIELHQCPLDNQPDGLTGCGINGPELVA